MFCVGAISMMETKINYIIPLLHTSNIWAQSIQRRTNILLCVHCFMTIFDLYILFVVKQIWFSFRSEERNRQTDNHIHAVLSVYLLFRLCIFLYYIHNNAWHSQLRLFVCICTIWVFVYKLIYIWWFRSRIIIELEYLLNLWQLHINFIYLCT